MKCVMSIKDKQQINENSNTLLNCSHLTRCVGNLP